MCARRFTVYWFFDNLYMPHIILVDFLMLPDDRHGSSNLAFTFSLHLSYYLQILAKNAVILEPLKIGS